MPENAEPYRVEISVQAAEMLVEHVRFLAQVSAAAALCLHDAFYEAAASLQELPQRHMWFVAPSLPRRKFRKLLFEKRYLLVYLVDEADLVVYVDYVLDCRQDYSWLI